MKTIARQLPSLPKRLRLTADYNTLPFDCDDADLNEFLIQDAKRYLQDLLAVTYLFEKDGQTLAFYSVSNDLIQINDAISKSRWKKIIEKLIPFQKKNWEAFPAVKIGRLGVHKDWQMEGIGWQIMLLLKADFTTNNKTGCRFITVDAYNKPDTISYYKRNGFLFMTEKDRDDTTRAMFFDLKSFKLLA